MIFVIIYVVINFLTISTHGYSREEVQEKYPGFGSEYILFPDDDGNPMYVYLNRTNYTKLFGIGEPNMDEDVKITYFSRKHLEGVEIKSKEDLSSYIDPSKPTKCVTHGWMSGGKKDSSVRIRDGFLYRYDANVLVMDWSAISGNPFYPIPMLTTPAVGEHYGTYLNHMVDELGVNPQDIHLVGHSLGAHVSGFAGRQVKTGKVGRITGLDPALPGFDTGLVQSGTLNPNDAHFVDIIHTCAGFLGYKTPLGHADFYPNGGGSPQPGCGILEFIEACSHGLSWKVFASSLVRDDPYVATRCSTLDELMKEKRCGGEDTLVGDQTPGDVRGIYYSRILEEDVDYRLNDKNLIK